jgi:hypothetical protein
MVWSRFTSNRRIGNSLPFSNGNFPGMGNRSPLGYFSSGYRPNASLVLNRTVRLKITKQAVPRVADGENTFGAVISVLWRNDG